MAIILNIDSSDDFLYISITKHGILLHELFSEEPRNHSAILNLQVEALLSKCKLSFKNLNAIALINGPGSYTGLRVGLSAAKGFCFALDIPIICISLTSAIAFQYQLENEQNLFPLIGAYLPMKNELICEKYDPLKSENQNRIHLQKNSPVDKNYFEHFLVVGNISLETIAFFQITHYQSINFKKSTINVLSNLYFKQNRFEHLTSVEPYYVKNFYIQG